MSTEAESHTTQRRSIRRSRPRRGFPFPGTESLPVLVLGLFLFSMAGACAQTGEGIPHTPTLPGLTGVPFPYTTPEEAGIDPEALDGMVEMVRSWVEEGDAVGAEVLLLKDRSIVLHETLGWSDREEGLPLERNSIFRIRSMTKPFTATAAFILMEEGRLTLDQRVSDYLPSWQTEASREITIRQLLSHTAGFVQGGFPRSFPGYGSLREAVDDVGEAGPQNPVGERYEYSDVDSATLGALVEAITGMPVEHFIETRILEPLGLSDTHTAFTPDVPWAPRMNPTYTRQNRGGPWIQYWHPSQEQGFPFFRASGGIYSTALDYARWLALFLDMGEFEGGRLLTEETIREAVRPAASPGYGLHWEIFSALPEDGGLPAFGHGGSDGTLALAFPYDGGDILAMVFTQSRGGGMLRRFIPPVRAVMRRGEGG